MRPISPHRLSVRTQPFHGWKRGSIPLVGILISVPGGEVMSKKRKNKNTPKKGNPYAAAHSQRGGAGAGFHKNKRRATQVPRKSKYKRLPGDLPPGTSYDKASISDIPTYADGYILCYLFGRRWTGIEKLQAAYLQGGMLLGHTTRLVAR